jgi:hypothetical protein
MAVSVLIIIPIDQTEREICICNKADRKALCVHGSTSIEFQGGGRGRLSKLWECHRRDSELLIQVPGDHGCRNNFQRLFYQFNVTGLLMVH